MKKTAIIIIVFSLILIVINILKSEKHEIGFWLRIASSVFVIVAMVMALYNQKKP